MDAQLGLGDEVLVDEEGSNLLTLVALELDDLTEFVVVDEGTVAGKVLFECLEELLEVEL